MQGKLTNELKNYTFAPKAPPTWRKNPDEWLSSLDIEKVMKQYERKYSCFDFIGPSPIDYDHHKMFNECVWDELCKFNLKKMIQRGKNKIGIVFNTDPHYKDGSHWIALFINIKKAEIYFFDSTGDPAPTEVTKLVKRLRAEGEAMGKSIHYYVNRYPHQRQNTECGVYGLYAVSKLLAGTTSPSRLVRGPRISDRTIWRFRKKFFNTPTNCAKSPKE